MANYAKYNSGAVATLCRHYERAKDSYSNEYIDKAKSHLNYNLAKELQPLNQLDFIKKRKSEVRLHNRKDVVVMCDWCVTLPAKVPDQDMPAFFENTFSFLKDKYGLENVISAYVHLDETNPHMHFAFIPVCYDRKKQIYKISASDLVTRTDLRHFHSELDKHLKKTMGYETGVINGSTNINVSLKQYKKIMEKVDILNKKAQEVNLEQIPVNKFTMSYKKEAVEKVLEKNKILEQKDIYLSSQIKEMEKTLVFAKKIMKRQNELIENTNLDKIKSENEETRRLNLDLMETIERLKRQLFEMECEKKEAQKKINVLEVENEQLKTDLAEAREVGIQTLKKKSGTRWG